MGPEAFAPFAAGCVKMTADGGRYLILQWISVKSDLIRSMKLAPAAKGIAALCFMASS
jgi:hypothetical protein